MLRTIAAAIFMKEWAHCATGQRLRCALVSGEKTLIKAVDMQCLAII
jgi:hypothetical protein